jgi:uncharacterized protein involved in exopolysaccharide biosynthesis
MRKDIDIKLVQGDAFRVSYVGTDRRTTMRVTERLASLFIEENLRDREVLAEGTNQFLKSQIEDARTRLIELGKTLSELRVAGNDTLPDAVVTKLEYDTMSAVFKDLLTKRAAVTIAANLERRQIGEQFKLLDPARLPERSFKPNRRFMTLVGAIAGLCLGLGMMLSGWGRPSGRRQEAVTVGGGAD